MSQRGRRRVAVVVPTLSGGGYEKIAVLLSGGLAGLGLPVDLVVLRREGAHVGAVDPAVRVIALKARRAAASVGRLRRYLETERPAAVLSMALPMSFACTMAVALSRWRPRLYWSLRSATSAALAEMKPGGRQAFRLGARLLAPRATGIVAVSEGVAQDFLAMTGLPRERMVTIYNAVPLGPPGPPPETMARLKARGPVVLAAGRLSEAKNYPLLLRAFDRIAAETDASLVILGEGGLRQRLEALTRELGLGGRVEMPGFVGDPLPWMAAADAFVLSSSREGFPNVLVEALSAGAPVIATDCPHGPHEILEGGRWGRLVPNRDADALAAAMRDVLDGGGIDGRERARDFDFDGFVRRYARLLEDGT